MIACSFPRGAISGGDFTLAGLRFSCGGGTAGQPLGLDCGKHLGCPLRVVRGKLPGFGLYCCLRSLELCTVCASIYQMRTQMMIRAWFWPRDAMRGGGPHRRYSGVCLHEGNENLHYHIGATHPRARRATIAFEHFCAAKTPACRTRSSMRNRSIPARFPQGRACGR